jgi:hypothetical protein
MNKIVKKEALFFGLKNGKLKHISEVDNGLLCNCYCPFCNNRLIAKNEGKERIKHFAHYECDDCLYGAETAIHYAVKEILETAKIIKVPKIEVLWEPLDINDLRCTDLVFSQYYDIIERHYIKIESVLIENKCNNIIPDVIIISNNTRIFIEVAVTHFVDDNKLEKIKKLNTSAIEIDMSKFKNFENLDMIKDYVVNVTENKQWIYSIPQEEELNGRIDVIKQREIDQSKNPMYTQINNKTMDMWRNNVEWNNDINPIDKFR